MCKNKIGNKGTGVQLYKYHLKNSHFVCSKSGQTTVYRNSDMCAWGGGNFKIHDIYVVVNKFYLHNMP